MSIQHLLHRYLDFCQTQLNYSISLLKVFSDISQKPRFTSIAINHTQKQPPRGVLKKRCSEIMQQIFKRTPMLKCDFNEVAIEIALGMVVPLLICSIFSEQLFPRTPLGGCFWHLQISPRKQNSLLQTAQFSIWPFNSPRKYSICWLNIWSFWKELIYTGSVYWPFKKLSKTYGIKGNNHNWIKSFLYIIHYIEIDPTATTSLELVK